MVLPRIAYLNLVPNATVTSSATTETDGPVSNLKSWQRHTFFKPTISGPVTVNIDFGGSNSVNCFCLAGTDVTGTVELERWNGSAYVDYLTATTNGDGSPVYAFSSTPQNMTKCRVILADLSYLSVLFVGLDFEAPEGVGPGWSDPVIGQMIETTQEISRDGMWLGAAAQRKNARLSLSLKNLAEAWVDGTWRTFMRYCQLQPFFLNWQSDNYSSSDAFCYNAKFDQPKFIRVGFMDTMVEFDCEAGSAAI
jgi:hypothetical protein